MDKKTFYWITMSYAGTFDQIKMKTDYAEEKDLQNGLYFSEGEEHEALHLKYLMQTLIKANYSRAKNWYPDLPQEYVKLLEKLKIELPKD